MNATLAQQPSLDDDYPRGSFLTGIGCSLTLHVLVIAGLLFGLRILTPRELPPRERMIPVDLVMLSDVTSGPAAEDKAAIPQQMATEQAVVPSPTAVPAPQSPPAPKVLRPAEQSAAAQTAAARAKAITPPRPQQPADELTARLEQLAKLQQPAPAQPPAPRDQTGPGISNITAASDSAAPGVDATYRVKDFLRAQIERRWNVQVSPLTENNLTAAIRIQLDPDGTVRRAEVVPDATHRNDQAYEDFARSARNAVLLSSPLTLLPGSYALAKDIVIDFNARRLVR
jgi:hypothetical protein